MFIKNILQIFKKTFIRMYKTLIFLLLLSLVFAVLVVNIKKEMDKDSSKIDNVGKMKEHISIPLPDRIIYKNKEGKYIILTNVNEKFQKIYTELYQLTDKQIEGELLTEDEITKLQEKNQFVEYDYNTLSKNYVFVFDDKEIKLIKRTSDGGRILANYFSEIEMLIENFEKITDELREYDFDKMKCYTEKTNIDKGKVPYYLHFEEVKKGVYQRIITHNDSEFNQIIKKFDTLDLGKIPKYDLLNESIIVTLSEFEIKNIKQNIGNVKYEFSNISDKVYINILVVSKVVNTNCIYYNFDENAVKDFSNENLNESNDDYAVAYYLRNNKTFSNYNGLEVEIIDSKKACDIANNEALNKKYQYQPWESVFLSRYNEELYTSSAELISNLSDISRLYHWEDEWKIKDYKDVLMWKVRLFDENDPLTSLYIYIDAITGDVIGAGKQSD